MFRTKATKPAVVRVCLEGDQAIFEERCVTSTCNVVIELKWL